MRIAIFSRYDLAEQYDLATEFRGMIELLGSHNEVFHLSLKGTQPPMSPPAGVIVSELPLHVDRNSPRDIRWKAVLTYFLLPLAVTRLRRFKPDLIFLSESFPLWAWLVSSLCRTRVAAAYGDWHMHNMLGRKWWSRPVLKLAEALDRYEMRRMRGFFCRAESAGERLKSWGISADRVRVVRDAPDPQAFFPRDASALRKQCGFNATDVVLLYHGVMHQGKGLDLLLRWCDDLYRELPGFGLILVGSGPEEGALRRLASELNIRDRVVFTGWLKTLAEVGEYCCAADICVAMRTADEANHGVVPGALLHCMACRRIVIAPRLRGTSEIIRHGENGYLFEADDGASFRQLVLHLVANRPEWKTVSDAAHQDILDHYSVDALSKQYAEALESFAQL